MDQVPRQPVQYPQWQPYPPPQPRRSGGGCVTFLVLALLIAAGVMLGRALVTQNGTSPGIFPARPTAPAPTSTVASGRRPGVVDINTELGLRNLRAAGTGIVLSSNGTVLTNNHVIAGATTINVVDTDNGRSFPARVVGYSKSKDLAVLQLQGAHNLPTAVIGDSRELNPGQVVTAVGNAGGQGGAPSVVGGNVIALDQAIVATDQSDGSSEKLSGLIQTSAPIKPGDSGGPLLDAAGRVIGIDTAATVGFRFQAQGGQGYAIPTADAMPIARQIQSGSASQTVHIGRTAMLGVLVRAADQSGAGSPGAIVVQVVPGAPAESAGLSQGAIIISLNGNTVDGPTALTDLLLTHHPGDTVQLGWSDQLGQQHTSSIQLADGPPQ